LVAPHAPVGLRRLGVLDRLPNLVRGGERDTRDQLARHRLKYVIKAARLSGNRSPAYQVTNSAQHPSPIVRRKTKRLVAALLPYERSRRLESARISWCDQNLGCITAAVRSAIPNAVQGLSHDLYGTRVLDRRRHAPLPTLCNGLDRAAQNLARTSFLQAVNDHGLLKEGNRPDLLANELHDLADHLSVSARHGARQDY
jgi:hypothetical protein